MIEVRASVIDTLKVMINIRQNKRYIIQTTVLFSIFFWLINYKLLLTIFFLKLALIYHNSQFRIYSSSKNAYVKKLETIKKPITLHPFNIFRLFCLCKSIYIKKVSPEKVFLQNNSIDIYKKKLTKSNDPEVTIIFVHGFSSDARAEIILDFISLFQNNYRCVSLNYRGSKCYPLKCSKFTHIGFTEDLKNTINYIRNRFKGTKIFIIGYSMGGNITTCLIGRDWYKENIDDIVGATVISTPLDFELVSKNNTIYKNAINSKLLAYHKNFLKNNSSVFKKDFYKQHMKSFNIHEINELMSKHLKYSNIKEYYKHNSSDIYLKNIKIPFMLINSADDFLITDYFPEKEFEQNPNLIGILTKKGGHLGFKDINFNNALLPMIDEFIALTVKNIENNK